MFGSPVMLLPILILATRLTFFFLAIAATLLVATITAIIPFVNILAVLSTPVLTVAWLNYQFTKWFYSFTLPNKLPGKKYHDYKRSLIQQKPQKKWLNRSSVNEGLLALFIGLISIAIVVIPAGMTQIKIDSEISQRLTAAFITVSVVLYGLVTLTGWFINKRKYEK